MNSGVDVAMMIAWISLISRFASSRAEFEAFTHNESKLSFSDVNLRDFIPKTFSTQ